MLVNLQPAVCSDVGRKWNKTGETLMQALQAVRPRSFDGITIPVPQLPPGGGDRVLIRTAWVSLCGSDIPFFTGNKRFQSYPLAPGAPIHECTGEVVESASELYKPGDLVIAIPDGNQGLAEYFIAQASRTVKLHDAVEDLGAACIIQPLSTAANALDRLGDLTGKSIAVVGLGSMGLLLCWLAVKRGAAKVIGIDRLENRCRFAESLGAAETICRGAIEVVHDARMRPESWIAPDICIEAVGHQMDTLNDCLELSKKRGTVLAFGVPDQPVYALEYEVFFRKNATLIASVTPEWKTYLSQAQDLFIENQKELSRFVSHRLPIHEAPRAFEMYERRQEGVIKVVLDASAW
jgi:L-iditol 2-dehydrogenase